VDTQHVLPRGTPAQVRDEVRRRIEDLAPGGGFVFTTVHNVQADVPPGNYMAMWEALREFGVYSRPPPPPRPPPAVAGSITANVAPVSTVNQNGPAPLIVARAKNTFEPRSTGIGRVRATA
jgi:hypothetical protein